uniref:phosphoglucomutase (alpha-D-glucose-1,6-bisphosphate-dependent) n=1 Tax=Mesocestoides corti TaxID=53468 RepID=A0A5K3EJM5_MESCO
PPLIFCKCHGTSRPGVQRRFLIVILLVRSLQRSCTPWLAISSSVSSTYSTHFWLRPLPTCSNFYSRARCFSDTAHFIVTTRTGAVENMIVEFNHFFFYLLPSSQMADEFLIQTRPTKPFEGQKPGTSGLRKPTKTFMLPNYVENFVQASLTVAKKHQKPDTQFRLVLGGDGRYFLKEALLNAIVPLCAANGVEEVMIGENGILSTPAISTIIRRYGTTGGFILTASHNPGGIDGDFGLKYNIDNGGPATETITDEIYQITTKIHEYQTLDRPIPIDLTKIGTTDYNLKGGKIFKVTIVSSTQDYITYMKEIFDFDMIKEFLNGGNGKPPFKVLVDGLSGVTGPYIRALLIDNFGLPESSTLDCTPLPDFGGHHPDPNLTYAAKLVDAVRADKSISLAAAFDGDGDRNMIIGQGGFFVCPCDSLAVIADNAESIKYFEKNGVRGFARSMPTSPAVDRVCKDKKIDVYETPTGWKFFGNLLDADKVSVCGEESFGTGSNHIREKDGIWTFLCWASLLAARQAAGLSPRVSDVMKEHWSKYGRDFFTRYDYEDCTEEQGKQVMERVEALLKDPGFVGRTYKTNSGAAFKVLSIDNFSYTDPVDQSVSKNQGIRIMLSNDTRFVYRISGTGSSGATIRIYVNTFSADPKTHALAATAYMAPHIELALGLCGIQYITHRTKPTVIT